MRSSTPQGGHRADRFGIAGRGRSAPEREIAGSAFTFSLAGREITVSESMAGMAVELQGGRIVVVTSGGRFELDEAVRATTGRFEGDDWVPDGTLPPARTDDGWALDVTEPAVVLVQR